VPYLVCSGVAGDSSVTRVLLGFCLFLC
jgi:hypothetical protein